MKVRIRFSKTGALIYIGHLDVMRYFQKLFRRSDIPVRYSEGFSPHQILSFSEPLPLGMESDGEYADVELTETVTTEDALGRLRSNSVPEIKIMSFKQLEDKCENAMAAVKAARYSVSFNDDQVYSKIKQAATDFMKKDVVNVIKKTKKNETNINLRPLVYELMADDTGLDMLVSSGSRDNIKPALVLEALSDICDTAIDMKSVFIRRIDQYTMTDDNRIVSLDDIGNNII